MLLHHWPAMLCGAVFNFVFGALWYGLVFTKPWLAALGITLTDIEDAALSRPRAYAASLLAAVGLAAGTNALVRWMDLRTAWSGAALGALCWATFNFTSFAKLLFFEDRPVRLVAINGGYDLVSFAVVGAIVAAWP